MSCTNPLATVFCLISCICKHCFLPATSTSIPSLTENRTPVNFLNRETRRRTARMKPKNSLVLPYFHRKKALALGLRLVWLGGIFLIGVSFYATQKLPSSVTDQIKKPNLLRNSFSGPFGPTITLFTAPRAFNGSVGERQALAVRSWLGLSPDITVVLFSQDPSAFSFAGAFGSRVSVEPNIDFSFLGTPFFHSMVARSQTSSSDISVLIDPEILLFPDFMSTMRFAHKLDQEWFLVASSQDISYFPFHLDANGKHWLADDGKKLTEQKLQEFLTQKGQWNVCQERVLVAWNNGDLPLHRGVLPPFLFGMGLHNHWVITEALSSDYRFIFDASLTISNIYVNDLENKHFQFGTSNLSAIEKRTWEFIGNFHLGMHYGSIHFHETNYSNLFRLIKCRGHYLFINTAEDIVYPLRYQMSFSLSNEGISGSTREKEIWNCIDVMQSHERAKNCSLKNQLQWPKRISLPYSLEFLLSSRANQNKTVVLAVAGYSYKDMLMSWVCRLRHLQISNFLICAIDREIYDFSVLQGLPVFQYASVLTNISFDNCHFGTECFQKVTKVKSRMVLQILNLGYNVLLSDVDVYWIRNPLPLLSSFGPAILVAQSDEYKLTGPINLPRRLNSGFYYAHSDHITVAAMEKVVEHAAASNLSEQPSFYDKLCGEGGSNRIGDNRCLEPETNLTVHFLDRDLFPNGAYLGLWEERNVKESCMKKGCFILHNNWISGRSKKLERQFGCAGSSTMLKRWVHILGLVRYLEKEFTRKKEPREPTISIDFSIQLRDITVRIVHTGGRVELYHDIIPASQIMQKYPGMLVAWPDIFKRPHEALLSAEDYLFPGHKYYVIPSTTVEKLLRKHLNKGNVKQPDNSQEPISAIKGIADIGAEFSEESVCSAKDFYVSKDRWSNCLLRRSHREKKPFVPPIQKPRMWKELEWEPSLTSIQELSP